MIVFSLSSLLKILYTKTDCREYIERASEEIKQKTEEFNEIAKLALKQNKQDVSKKQKATTVAERVFSLNFKNPALKTGAAILTGGASLLTGFVGDKIDDKIVKNNERKIEHISSLQFEDNPYIVCIQNLELITNSDNIVFFDDDYLYYQIPETCGKMAE